MFTRALAILFIILAGFGVTPAFAQEGNSAGKVELTIIPAGGFFFQESDQKLEPGFGNYGLGGSLAVNFAHVGLEGEVGGALGIPQNLTLGSAVGSDLKTPNLMGYSGNVNVPLVNRGSSVVPYVTAGVGGITVLERTEVGVSRNDTFLTGNAGGGVKWYFGRWGARADYRFVAARSKEDASSFFGRENRYGHRVYGGVILNLVR